MSAPPDRAAGRRATLDDVRGDGVVHRRLAIGCSLLVVLLVAAFYWWRVAGG